MIDTYGMAYKMQMTPDTEFVFLVKSQKVQMVSTLDGTLVNEFRLTNVKKVVVSPDGCYVLFAMETPSCIKVYRLEEDFPLHLCTKFPTQYYSIAAFLNNEEVIAAAGNMIYSVSLTQKQSKVIYSAPFYSICNSLLCNNSHILATFNCSSLKWQPPFVLSLDVSRGVDFPEVQNYEFAQFYQNVLEYGCIDWAYWISSSKMVIAKQGFPYDVFVAKIQNNTIQEPIAHRYFDNTRWSFCSQTLCCFGVVCEENDADVLSIESFAFNEAIYYQRFGRYHIAYPSFCENNDYVLIPHIKASTIVCLSP